MVQAAESTLLVVEDDLRLRALYARSFETSSMSVLTAAGLLDARGILRTARPDAVILDIGLEDDSGLQLLGDLAPETIVVVVTGQHEKDLVREALAAGADDVVFKPFVIEELIARVLGRLEARARNNAIQRSGEAPSLVFDMESGTLYCGHDTIITRLSNRESRTLKLLIDARGEVVTRDELSMRIHGEPWDPDSRKVDALVSRLRKKLECDDCGIHRSLSTVHNRGYRFDDSVQIELEGTS